MSNTLVIGASENEARFSYKAIKALLKKNETVIALGKDSGQLDGVPIQTSISTDEKVDTATLYINPSIQTIYEEFLLELNPNRVIFNPGTENPVLEDKLKNAGITTLNACTLVLLAANQY